MTDSAAVLDAPAPRARSGSVPAAVPVALAAAGVLSQIAYPLLSGGALRAVTIAAVALLAAAALAHAARAWGVAAAGVLLITAGGIGLLAEAVGVGTGFPFGEYAYAGTLGPKLLGVPVVVPLAWTMLALPCLLLGRRLGAGLGGHRVATALTGGLALAAWDLYLDPQMVTEGHWNWRFPEPALPGVPGVPLTNFAGWVLVAMVMVAVLDRVLPRASRVPETVPAAVLTWTWAGSAVGNLVFFDRPWVALYGGLAMGALVVPYLLTFRPAHSRGGPR